jgi:iron complex outermembrane receptor protein
MIRKTLSASLLAGTAAAALLASGAAQAQSVALEEIVVTAQKRTENLQQIPIAITAISGEELDRIDLNEIQDIAIQTPSLEFSRAGGEAQLYIRGIGTNIFGVTVDPSVAVNQDGVYLARTQMGLTQFLDVDRVEILRGPQGTLYGRNATGGAINLISRKPADEVEGYASAIAGNFGRYEFQGAVSAPLSDVVKTRLAARFLEDDGFTKDLDPRGADEIDDQNMFAMRGTVEFDVNDDVTFTVVADWSDFTSHNRSVVPRDNLGLAETLGALPTGGIDETRNNLPTKYDWETGGITATLDWQINDGIALKSISAYKEFTGDFLFNTDGTEADVTRSNFQYDTDQFTQEIQLSSTDDGAFQWIAGVYYLTEDKYGALGLIRPPIGLSFIIPNDDTGEAYAAYVQGTYQFTDELAFTAGVRYSDETKKDVTSVGAVFDFDGLDSVSDVTLFGPPREAKNSWDAWTPRFVLEYTPNDDMLFYASATRGFKSGGFNAFDRTPAFNPEFIWSYEIGTKSDITDTLRVNATGFYYDYSDLQVTTFINGLTLTTNAAEATVKGIEFEVTSLLTEDLEFNLSGTWLDAEYDQFFSAQGVDANGPRIFDLSGNKLINAPEWTFNASLNYTVNLASGGTVDLFGQVTYRDELFFTQFNEPLVGSDDITLVDARIAYTTPDGSWSTGIYGKNIFDEEYFQNGVRFTSTSDPAVDVNAIGNALGYPAPGAQYGVQVNYRF